MIYVFGHKVPDTDSIVSSLIYANLLNARGIPAKAVALWKGNNESLFVLNQVGYDHPEVITTLPEWSSIALVDHNELSQSLDDRHQHTILSVVDHHRIGDFVTGWPLHMRLEPLACTTSILYKMYREHNIAISPKIATLMLAWILSDTLFFRSPTTTEEDKHIASELQEIAHIDDIESFAMKMFAAKSDLGDISVYSLIKETDFKEFTFGSLKAGIACIETTNPSYCLNRKDEIINAIQTIKAEEWYDFILVCVVDIINEHNITIIASQTEADIVSKVFGADTVDGLADLGGRISRKKQIIPDLEAKLA